MIQAKKISTAAILVGGKGARLRPIVNHVPKPLASIHGIPFLYLLLKKLSDHGIKKIILLTGYMQEQIKTACNEFNLPTLEIIFSCEDSPLGTAGALKKAEQFLNEESEFILLNGDTFFDCDLNHFLQSPLEDNLHGLIGVTEVIEPEHYGVIKINSEFIITHFQEKNSYFLDSESEGYVSAGIYKLSNKIFTDIHADGFSSLEESIFPEIISQGPYLKAVHLHGQFYDIGTPESYKFFNKWCKETQLC